MIGKLLDRYMWVVDLVIIAVFATFLAAGVDHFLTGLIDDAIQGALAQRERPSARSRRAGAARAEPRFEPVDGTDILRRNLFDSITGPLDGMPDITADLLEPPVEQTPDPEAEGVIPPRCEARLRLQACYSAPNHPDYSFAALSVDNEEKLVHVGDTVEDLRVAEITWRYVYMQEQGGSTCYVDLWNEDLGGEGAPPSMTSAPKTPAQKKAMGAKTASSPAQFQGLLNKSIKDVSPTEKDVDRSLIDYLVQNKQMLMQSGRVLPNVEGDEINGFKVYGIRKTSLWGKLGIHNGDVVLSVNELSMDGPDKAYEAFAGLSGTDTMDVKVLRHGKPMTFTYNIK